MKTSQKTAKIKKLSPIPKLANCDFSLANCDFCLANCDHLSVEDNAKNVDFKGFFGIFKSRIFFPLLVTTSEKAAAAALSAARLAFSWTDNLHFGQFAESIHKEKRPNAGNVQAARR